MVQDIISWGGFYSRSYKLLGEHIRGKPSVQTGHLFAELERIHSQNPPNEGHWEFLAIALLHSFDQNANPPTELIDSLSRISMNFVQKPKTVNWRLMSRIVQVRLLGRRLLHADLIQIGLRQHLDGFLPDHPTDNSTQYHAYLLLLVLRFGDISDRQLSALVHAAFRWLFSVYKELGDPSPLGRGRFQIFGYASMVAAADLASVWGVKVPNDWLYAAQISAIPESPSGALSSCWTGPHRHHLLHGYNSTCDYAEFSRFWAGLRSECAPCFTNGPPQIYVHALGGHAAMVSVGRGPFLFVAPEPTETLSRKQLIRSVFSRKDSTETAPPQKLRENHQLPDGILQLHKSGNIVELILTTERVAAVEHFSFSVWYPEHVQIEETALRGSVEFEQLTWVRGGQHWNGLRVRTVRRGEYRMKIYPCSAAY